MRAGEHQREPLIGNCHGLSFRRGQILGQKDQMRLGQCPGLPPPCRIDLLASRHGQQPRLRIVRRPGLRPLLQRRREGVGEGILRRRNIAAAGRQEGYELAVALPGNPFGRGLSCRRA